MTTEERFYEIRDEFAAANRALQEISGDWLICAEPEEGPAGEVAVTVSTKPPGATQWTSSASAAEVTLERKPSGEVTQQLTTNGYLVAVTDTQVATKFGVEVGTWTRSRDAIEGGLGRVAGVTDPEPRQRVATDLGLYRAARTLSRKDPGAALMLGVTGNNQVAQRERLAQAVAVRESWHAAADAAYTKAATYSAMAEEPDVPQPFGLGAVIRAGGDLERALGDAEVRWQTAERLGLTGHMAWVQDEIFDGQVQEWRPDISDTPEGRHEIGEELARIAHEVGVGAPASGPARSSAAEHPKPLNTRPALMPPGMRPLRPEERAPSSPGLSAPGPGIPF